MRPRPLRRLSFGFIVVAALALQAAITAAFAQAPKRELAPLSSPKIALVAFENSPFPYRGEVPEKNKPFIDVIEGDRLGHTSPRGGIYWEDQTYSDRRALLYIPRGFDPRRPALVVVFFHGNEATLTRDVRNRQEVPRQLAESGLIAVELGEPLARLVEKLRGHPRFPNSPGAGVEGDFGIRACSRSFSTRRASGSPSSTAMSVREAPSTALRSCSSPIAAATIRWRSSCIPAGSMIACAGSSCSTACSPRWRSSLTGSRAGCLPFSSAPSARWPASRTPCCNAC